MAMISNCRVVKPRHRASLRKRGNLRRIPRSSDGNMVVWMLIHTLCMQKYTTQLSHLLQHSTERWEEVFSAELKVEIGVIWNAWGLMGTPSRNRALCHYAAFRITSPFYDTNLTMWIPERRRLLFYLRLCYSSTLLVYTLCIYIYLAFSLVCRITKQDTAQTRQNQNQKMEEVKLSYSVVWWWRLYLLDILFLYVS